MELPDLKSLKLTAQDTFIGTTIADKYELVQLLGSGGAGSVYKAKHKHLSRIVAIKILHQHLVNSEPSLHRFKQEAEAISRLNNPGLVPLYDFGLLDNGTPYMVMEFQAGTSMEDYLAKERRPVVTLIELFIQIAEVLSYAHKQGIIHRDVKPSNIIITGDTSEHPVPKLVDFGLAKADYASKDLTASGIAVGTPQYMSPEQCQGMRLDARSDIYSLGCIMYEAFTGHQVVSGDNMFECMTGHLKQYPQPLAQAAPNVDFPSGLDNLVFKAIAKEREDRYKDADQLLADLRSVLAGTGAAIKRGRRRLPTGAGSEQLMIAVAAGALLAIGICTAAFLWRMQAPEPPRDQTVQALDATAEKAMTAENYQEAEKTLLEAKQKARAFGRYSKPYRTQLEMLSALYGQLKEPDKKSAIDAELRTVDENSRFGTIESNAQKIAELMVIVNQQPNNSSARTKLITTLNDQGALLCQMQRFADAKPFLTQALGLETKSMTKNVQTARTYNNLAVVSFFLTDKKQAEIYYKQALTILKASTEDSPMLAGRIMRNLSEIYRQSGRLKEAQQQLESALAVYKDAFGEGSHYEVACRNALADVLIEEGTLNEAQKQLDTALAIQQTSGNSHQSDLVNTYCSLGKLKAKLGQNQAAEDYYRKAVELAEREFDPDDPTLADAIFDLASQYQSEAKFDIAAPLFVRAKNIREHLGSRMHNTITGE